MSLEIRWLPRARRDLKRLDPPTQRRVVEAVEHLAQTGEGDVKRLQNVTPPEFRLRVGGWRIRFGLSPDARALDVLRVLPRGKAYRD
jgi:mRNA-degrading endonuclease RelE of RelBE toxin-antitoxin system